MSANVCTYTTQNATYNLEPLSITSESDRYYHLIHDQDPSRNYSYYFNFCDVVHYMPLDICNNETKRSEFAQGYCKPYSELNSLNECPADNIIQITGNGMQFVDTLVS